MKKALLTFILVAAACLCRAAAPDGGGTIVAYPAPQGAPMKHDYEVYVSQADGLRWTRIDTYMAKVNSSVPNALAAQGTGHRISEISYAVFDFTGQVSVKVVTRQHTFKTAVIRPRHKGIAPRIVNDSTLLFTLSRPENLSVELDGDITANLLLFTSAPPTPKDVTQRQAKDQGRSFVYYEPGLYTQDTIRIPSNTTVYLAGGTYFTGTFSVRDAQNVTITGRGIARTPSGLEGCHVQRSHNVLIEGLTLCTCPVGGSDGVVIRDVRSISHPGWGDGLNVFASSNVLYDRVFCRNSDDCTTAYATRKGFSGNVRNIHMKNATLWADVAHPIFIGIHGNAERGDTIEHLLYEDIDILHQAEPQVDYQGCMAINCGDNNLVRDVTFSDIRIENIEQGCLLQVKVGFNQKYCKAPGRGVHDVTFRNIAYSGSRPYLSLINGYNEERRVSNVRFENLIINGRTISDDMPGKPRWYATADYVPMMIGNHVDNVTFTR